MIKRILITALICLSLIGLGYEIAIHQTTGSWNWPTWNWGSNGSPKVSAEVDYYSWSCSQLQQEINHQINLGNNSGWAAPATSSYTNALTLQHIYEEKGCHP